LTKLDLLLPVPNTALRDDIDRALRGADVTLRPALELDGIRMIASLTFDGFGPAILPATAVPRHMRERFELVSLEGFPRRLVGVALRRRGLPSAPTRAVIDILNAIANDPHDRPLGLHPLAEAKG
jgi:LysR family hydrogen peroxide-inducible transcriptional activator